MTKQQRSQYEYFIASSFDERLQNHRPRVPIGKTTLAQLDRKLRLAAPLHIWRLQHRKESDHPPVYALWIVLRRERSAKRQPSPKDTTPLEVLFSGTPERVWTRLRKQGLPTPSDAIDVTRGLNGEDFTTRLGVAVSGRFGKAKSEAGVACGFLADAATDRGVAVVWMGKATAGDRGTAISCASGSAVAGDHGLAACMEEFGVATAGMAGVAVGNHMSDAIAGDHGVAVTTCGSAQAGIGGVLVFRQRTHGGPWFTRAFVVGTGSIKPNTPYTYSPETDGLTEAER